MAREWTRERILLGGKKLKERGTIDVCVCVTYNAWSLALIEDSIGIVTFIDRREKVLPFSFCVCKQTAKNPRPSSRDQTHNVAIYLSKSIE